MNDLSEPRAARAPGDQPTFTLQQLRIFRTIAVAPSLTRAAKDLGISQPSLSQHLAKLEERIGSRLFERRGNQLILSDVGGYLLQRTDRLLAEADETEARLAEFADGSRGRVAVGVLPSIGRSLMPPAMAEMAACYPDLELDLHEMAPLEMIDQLYARNLQLAVLAANTLADSRLSFARRVICSDPYLLAVPATIDLTHVQEPESELPECAMRILRRTILFDFGNQHNQRIQELYRRLVPSHHTVACCRSYDTALAMVQAGQGVAIAPQLAAELAGKRLYNVHLFELPIAPRQLAVFGASQYNNVPVFKKLIDAIAAVGDRLPRGPTTPPPPFTADRLRDLG